MADLSITAANVVKSSSGQQAFATLAATVTQGQALYQLAAGTFGLADANGASPANTFAGIALSAGSTGQVIAYCPSDSGAFTLGASGMTVGQPIFLSKTPGGLTQTFADISGGLSIVVGNCLSATTTTIISGGAVGGTAA